MASSVVSKYHLYSIENAKKASIPTVISVLSSLLERVVSKNNRVLVSGSPYETFHGKEVPDMTIEKYLERIYRYAHCSPSVFIVAYVYIDRLTRSHPQFQISSLNIHRILITSVMIASKFVEDINYKNSYYARVGGVSTSEMNRLEMELLSLLGFKLQVTIHVFQSYCSHLEREMAIGGGFQIERSLRLYFSKGEISPLKAKRQLYDTKCGYQQRFCAYDSFLTSRSNGS